jgi:hypothetical protein
MLKSKTAFLQIVDSMTQNAYCNGPLHDKACHHFLYLVNLESTGMFFAWSLSHGDLK